MKRAYLFLTPPYTENPKLKIRYSSTYIAKVLDDTEIKAKSEFSEMLKIL